MTSSAQDGSSAAKALAVPASPPADKSLELAAFFPASEVSTGQCDRFARLSSEVKPGEPFFGAGWQNSDVRAFINASGSSKFKSMAPWRVFISAVTAALRDHTADGDAASFVKLIVLMEANQVLSSSSPHPKQLGLQRVRRRT